MGQGYGVSNYNRGRYEVVHAHMDTNLASPKDIWFGISILFFFT